MRSRTRYECMYSSYKLSLTQINPVPPSRSAGFPPRQQVWLEGDDTATNPIDKHQPPLKPTKFFFFVPFLLGDDQSAAASACSPHPLLPSSSSRTTTPFFFFSQISPHLHFEMSDGVNGAAERYAIGISFGNSSSSIARINPVREKFRRC